MLEYTHSESKLSGGRVATTAATFMGWLPRARRREDSSSESEEEDSDRPVHLPDGWETYTTDDEHRFRYYYNTFTRQSTWSRPPVIAPLPAGWTCSTTTDGATYYTNPRTMQSTWTRPISGDGGVTITIRDDEEGRPAAPSDPPLKTETRRKARRDDNDESDSDDNNSDPPKKRSCLVWLLCLPFGLLGRALRCSCAVLCIPCKLFCMPCKLCAKLPCVAPFVFAAKCAYKVVAAPFHLAHNAVAKAASCTMTILSVALCLCLCRDNKKRRRRKRKQRKRNKLQQNLDTKETKEQNKRGEREEA